VPPPASDGAAPCDAEFHPEGVMGDKPFDESLWAGLFAEFGPMLPTPKEQLAVGETPAFRTLN